MSKQKNMTGQIATLKKVMHYLKHYIPILILSVVLATVTVALTLYFPILTGRAIDLILDKGNVDFPGILAIAKEGAIVINTTKSPEQLRGLLKGYEGDVYTIDARKVSMETLGRYFPNTPMLAAIVKVSGIMTDEELLNDMEGSFKHKFAKKPEVIEGNMKALEMALKEVKKI